MLMSRAGIKGIVGRRKWRRARPDLVSADLVDRQFARQGLDQLWVTDITEHPTREGKVYCAVVLDVCSRRVVGRAIDSSPTAIEAHHPGIDALEMPADVVAAWRERLRSYTGRAGVRRERGDPTQVMMAVRIFYLDLQEWALPREQE
ncbi:DDE-type integrase/transposase/recombinase [Nocardiopsis synnemataformans]|uniref:DDE-type integrase/transposase/recombinase n=1 Tax=Nocardiopsis synnemataformans TaxID=61305 RepID=UPI003EBC6939